MRVWLACLIVCLGLWAGVEGPALAQDQRSTVRSPVLIVDSDALFRTSAFGLRVAAEIAAESEALEADNARFAAELEAEEKTLTAQRAELPADEFRALADAFDARVRNVRREQLAKARDLQRREADLPPEFLIAVAPVLEEIMVEAGAVVILEGRSVRLSRNVIDITAEAVTRINARIGDGAGLEDGTDDTGAAQDGD